MFQDFVLVARFYECLVFPSNRLKNVLQVREQKLADYFFFLFFIFCIPVSRRMQILTGYLGTRAAVLERSIITLCGSSKAINGALAFVIACGDICMVKYTLLKSAMPCFVLYLVVFPCSFIFFVAHFN